LNKACQLKGSTRILSLKGMTFESLILQNQHLMDWERNVVDTRIHGTTKKHVGKQFLEFEKQALGPLPTELFPFYEEGIRKVRLIGPQSLSWAQGVNREHGVQGMRICSLPFRLWHYAINLRRTMRRNPRAGCLHTSLAMRL
jgi:hypothetical protein